MKTDNSLKVYLIALLFNKTSNIPKEKLNLNELLLFEFPKNYSGSYNNFYKILSNALKYSDNYSCDYLETIEEIYLKSLDKITDPNISYDFLFYLMRTLDYISKPILSDDIKIIDSLCRRLRYMPKKVSESFMAQITKKYCFKKY